MNQFSKTLGNHLTNFGDYLPTIFYALIVLLLSVLLGYLIAALVKRGFKRANFPQTYQSFFLKMVRWLCGIVGILLALKILGFGGIATSILASGGVTAIILGFAFRDIGENILAGFFLAFSRPFNIGDLIRSEGLEGRVKSVDLRHTHIRTGDGCDIFIPSAQIFTQPLLNFTRDGLRRIDFNVGIDYADDTRKATELLLKVVRENDRIISDPAPKVKISGFTPNYVEINVAFWINTFKQEAVMAELKSEVMNDCRVTLLEHNVTLSSSVTTALSIPPIDVNAQVFESNKE